ncbi:MAG: ABC-type antimicrobial peptide transport system, ATPase component [candidate division TM6 bacterium GW2011_GWF2_32_72]|nr:MAG: ABC-type antimicrobial peptide transport system, ATPase component [candidate division TM6 bacterium GW2011_GWF2_32_72]
MNNKLAAVNICKSFKQGKNYLEVLNDISIEFNESKSYAITGVSGTGKSTFLHILSGIEKPTTGNIFYNLMDINAIRSKHRDVFYNQEIGLVFQQPHLIRELSVLENIMLKGLIAGEPQKKCRQKALELLKKVDLSAKAEEKPNSLSGGQQQRVAILRALYNQPKFLLADEPTGSLDEETAKQLVDFILECKNIWSMGLIISSHDKYVAEKMDMVFKLHNGDLEKI